MFNSLDVLDDLVPVSELSNGRTSAVLNKADRVKPDTIVEPADAILISARDGMGLETLKAEIARRIAALISS